MAISNSPAQDYVQSDYTNSARLNINGSAQEQKFMENLIVESIEIYGQNIYYVPRTIVNRDTIFEEDSDFFALIGGKEGSPQALFKRSHFIDGTLIINPRNVSEKFGICEALGLRQGV